MSDGTPGFCDRKARFSRKDERQELLARSYPCCSRTMVAPPRRAFDQSLPSRSIASSATRSDRPNRSTAGIMVTLYVRRHQLNSYGEKRTGCGVLGFLDPATNARPEAEPAKTAIVSVGGPSCNWPTTSISRSVGIPRLGSRCGGMRRKARPAGLESTTFGLRGPRVYPLSYGRP
jgi:hypothetical protein